MSRLNPDSSGISCGVDLLVDILDFTEREFKVAINGVPGRRSRYSWYDWKTPPSFFRGQTYIFSDAVKMGNGVRLARLIKKYKLGPVTSTPPAVNPNSGRKIKVWVWRYNGRKIKESTSRRAK
jgi:hypothetical protein